MGIEVVIRVKSIEDYIRRKHGKARTMSASERRILGRYAGDIVEDIENAWPVDTSTSRDAFMYTIDGGPARVAILIENDVDYAEYVHRKGEPADPPLYETLIPKVWNAYRPDLLADLRAEVDKTETLIKTSGLSVSQVLSGQRPKKAAGVSGTASRFAIPARRSA